MTDSWNGLPDQPERSGWHWLAPIERPDSWFMREWSHLTARFISLGCYSPENPEAVWVYGGPVLKPPELAQMRKGERERDDRILLPTYDAFCNDAKGLMSSEFHFQGDEEECQECGGTGIEGEYDEGPYECMRCDGTGVRRGRITVPWTTIKEIYRVIVDKYGPCTLTDNEGKKS